MIMPDMETNRLLIRATREEDGPACLSIWLDEEMGRYLSDPPLDKADAETLGFAKGIERDEGWYPWWCSCGILAHLPEHAALCPKIAENAGIWATPCTKTAGARDMARNCSKG